MADVSALEHLALLEERDRRQARASFLAFYARMTGFSPPRHVRKIASLLQAMEEDRIDRAMLFAPPRHAKTLLSTTLFPSWIMGRDPTALVMSVVHTQRYAGKIGRQVRNLFRHPEWPWPDVMLAEDSQERHQFATAQGGEYNAFGATAGNQHGTPAEWLLMDDLIKGRGMALSPHMRAEVWDNYQADFVSRLQGRAKQLMTFTRWHEDDPAGRILPAGYDGASGWMRDRETGERWYVLSLAACAERADDPLGRQPGEWLWPERFDSAKMEARRTRGGWMWSALYQQRPAPEAGLLFSAEHIQRYRRAALDRTTLRVYLSSDYAVTSEAGAPDPDYTVHMAWGVDDDYNLFLLDIWRGRTTSDVWVDALLAMARRWRPLQAVGEGGVIARAVRPLLNLAMQRQSTWLSVVDLPSSSATGNKEQRAHALLGHMAAGKVFLPHREEVDPSLLPALDAFEAELLAFPAGRHDDCVDAATLMGRYLDRVVRGRRVEARGRPHGETLDDLWLRHDAAARRRECEDT